MTKVLAIKYNILYGIITVMGSKADVSKSLLDEKIIDSSTY
jgi:hypothetical protein